MQMHHYVVSLCAALAMTAPIASAQNADDDKLLLPIAPQRVVGAFGSEWLTDAAVTNMSDSPVKVNRDPPANCVLPCASVPIPPRSTVFVSNIPLSSSSLAAGVRGTFLFVEHGRVGDLAVTLRTRDLSRQKETWGTGIPVVSAQDLFATRFGIVDVPLEAQFRSTLRIYDFDAETPPKVRVRFYRLDPTHNPDSLEPDADTLLLDIVPTFNLPVVGARKLLPASVEIPLWLVPELAAAGRVRVQIDPINDTRDYWGFVSVTHNETQHVTVISPH